MIHLGWAVLQPCQRACWHQASPFISGRVGGPLLFERDFLNCGVWQREYTPGPRIHTRPDLAIAGFSAGVLYMFTVGLGLGRQRVQCVARLGRLWETKRGVTPNHWRVHACRACTGEGKEGKKGGLIRRWGSPGVAATSAKIA